MDDGRKRVIIENVMPCVENGKYHAKGIAGQSVKVTAEIFADGHDEISAVLLYKKTNDRKWKEAAMEPVENDVWECSFVPGEAGLYSYTVRAWIDHFKTWQVNFKKKVNSGQNIKADMEIGLKYMDGTFKTLSETNKNKIKAYYEKVKKEKNRNKIIEYMLDKKILELLQRYSEKSFMSEYNRVLVLEAERKKAGFSAWYELFPRSFSKMPGKHGTFKDCERLLPEIADMGFDVLYFPPIHPIGKTKRKGKNNSLLLGPDDPGSPWAIGSEYGGHMSVNPELGTMKDFERLIKKAQPYGIEIAIDIAFQCSQDHPYIREHPEWFVWRPDGNIQFAENPPKKYEDIVPFNFESTNWQELWNELKRVIVFWINRGVKIFRIDNPHTKPFLFWEEIICGIKKDYPDIILLAEAFTRPKKMYELAKLGFTQGYTYFTWRYSKKEFIEYMKELTQTEIKDIFRPNFWPNTPDILSEDLQYAGRPAFIKRLILAATLSSNYGMYGPAFELMDNIPYPGKEEYNNNEKYEIKQWDRNKPGSLRGLIKKVNTIRKENAALHRTDNIRFYEIENEYLMVYGKTSDDMCNTIITAVSFDAEYTQSGWVRIPIKDLGINPGQEYVMHDLLTGSRYKWKDEWNYIELRPESMPAHIFRLEK